MKILGDMQHPFFKTIQRKNENDLQTSGVSD